jgi:acetyl-CoA carboxylase carboxyl transferase subunit beta
MSWLKKAIPPKIKNILGKVKKNIPEGLWQKCPSCQTVLYGTDLEKNNYVCPN